ncbi:hypothetical protein MNBD_BACTEROID03-1330 [hydrothermal vent metagenome]|uniref:Uncharacterized protein n=1 Tax=hydrothermal vent metagenome TaxID=652676 RepID=A0A3B0TDK8_9ZZZZ
MGNTFKRQLFFVIVIALNSVIMGQAISTDDVVGQYNLPSSDPQGGESVFVFPDNTFLTVYFGGMLKGDWKIVEDEILFKTVAVPQVVMYGRKLNSLRDTTQMDFNGFTGNRVLVSFGEGIVLEMRTVFNKNANCFDSPYLYKTTTALSEFGFAMGKTKIRSESDYNSLNLYQYENLKKYNDLIAVNLPSEYTSETVFSAKYVNGNLFFNHHSTAASRRELDDGNEEDTRFFKEFMKRGELLPDILEYGGEFYPVVEHPTDKVLRPFYKIEPSQIKVIKKRREDCANQSISSYL